MRHMLRKLILASTFVFGATPSLRAQRADARATEVGIAVGGSAMPDAISAQCGSRINGDGAPGGEVGLSVLHRVGGHVALQADTRFTTPLMGGCYLVLPAVDTSYAESLSRSPLTTSTVRVAAETPPSLPLFRLTAGAGVAWGSPRLPLGVVALAWSTRGEHRRFFVEFERMQTRVHAEERHHLPPAGQQPFTRGIVLYPVEHTLRLGFSWLRG
jgi:hypothetical protein